MISDLRTHLGRIVFERVAGEDGPSKRERIHNTPGERWFADVGVRFVRTKTSAQAWDAKINEIVQNGAFNFTPIYADPSIVRQDATYSFALPSGNFTYSLTDKLQLRVGAAKTMARPSVDKLAPSSTTASSVSGWRNA